MFNMGKYLISGIITILAVMIFISTAYAQCGQSATLDFTNVNVSDIFVPNPVLSNCSVTPLPLQVPTNINSADPVTINFTGGRCISAFPFSVYASLDLYDEFNQPCPVSNGFTNQLQFSLSRPVRAVLFQIGNLTSTSQTYTVTSDAGDTQQLTIAAQAIGNVQIQPANVANVITSITVTSTVNDPTRRGFAIGYVTLVYIDSSTQAGTITATPSSAESGANVTILGTDWKNGGAINSYRVLFDNMVVANGASLCFQQPNIGFNIPCGTVAGTHTVTCQLINTATQQVLTSSQTQLEVTGSGANCPCIVQVGAIAINPSSGNAGDEVTLNGSGWISGTSGQYQILFDGVPLTGIIQPIQSCTDQPNITFNIPCKATTGQHVITCQLGSLISAPFTFTVVPSLAPAACGPSVKFKYSDGKALPSPFRIGVANKLGGNKHPERIVHLLAEISPADFAQDVTLSVNNKRLLSISNMKTNGGVITFDVEGLLNNLVTQEPVITVTHKTSGIIGQLTVRVVVPYQIANKNHDTIGRQKDAEVKNLAGNEATSPAIVGIPKNKAALVTYYQRFLKIEVVDQYGEPVGKIYEGAMVEELIDPKTKKFAPINQRLQSDSTYLDPVGIIVPKVDIRTQQPVIVNYPSVESTAWENPSPNDPNNQPIILTSLDIAGSKPEIQNITVRVDGFELNPSVKNRILRLTLGPSYIMVVWPDYK